MKSMNFVCGSTGAMIFLLLVVGSNAAADQAFPGGGGASLKGKCFKNDKGGATGAPYPSTVTIDTACKGDMLCYKDPPKSGADGVEVATAAGAPPNEEGKCHCPTFGHVLDSADKCAEPSKTGTIGHGQECLKHDECKTYLGCFKEPAKKGETGKPDEGATTANKLTATSAATDKGTCLCEGDKMHTTTPADGCTNPPKQEAWGNQCEAGGCVGDLKCRLGGEKSTTEGKPDTLGTGEWAAGGTTPGKCVCADKDKPVRKSGDTCDIEKKDKKKHGEDCGTDECETQFACRVGGAKGEYGDKQGTGDGGSSAPGICVCPKDKTVPKDKTECADAKKPLDPSTEGSGSGSGTETSGSDRIVYQLMSSVAAMGSLLLL